MNILVADSGSTKTDWALISDGVLVGKIKTKGLNPYHHTSESIESIIREDLITSLEEECIAIDTIYFYGAGCSNTANNELIRAVLQLNFANATIKVEHDLFGAAVALCGSEPGIVAILGTGSNSCKYDGEEITQNILASGYILGDEGSGSYLGKRLLQDFINNEMPKNIKIQLQNDFDLSPASIMENVYQQSLPNRYMASFAKWVNNHIDTSDYLEDMVNWNFQQFFDQHINNYSDKSKLPLNVLGSVGYHFLPQLKEVAHKNNCRLGMVLQSPMKGLVDWHTTNI